MVVFQNPNPELAIRDKVTGEIESFPRIILQNSHDGFNSFKFMAGLYRCVCSNGLVIADAEYAKLSIRHINYSFEEVRLVIEQIVNSLPEKIKVIDDMKKVTLTDEQKAEFATNVIKLRKNVPIDENFEVSESTIADILTPVRKEDKGNSLWNVFNVLQEKVMLGNFNFSKNDNSKSRKMRKIVSPVKDVKINYEMFNLANSYMSVAA